MVVLRFPLRRVALILVVPDRDGGGWLTLAGAHGWLHGSRDDAVAEAQWLSANFNLPMREVAA